MKYKIDPKIEAERMRMVMHTTFIVELDEVGFLFS
jgi:hypothetical protein